MLADREQNLQQRTVTPERLMLDTVERIGRLREGRVAVHLHLSALQPEHRTESHQRIAERLLDSLAASYRAQIFVLGNGDIIVLGRDLPQDEMEVSIDRVRSLYSTDPLTNEDAGDGSDRFVTWHDIERDYETFLDVTIALEKAADARRRTAGRRVARLEPVGARELDALLQTLERVDVSRYIRRQAAVHVLASRSRAEVAFQEFFFSMGELQRVVFSLADLQRIAGPKQDISANRWLFRHLTTVLDRMMLKVLTNLKLNARPPVISVNLNVNTMGDPAFFGLLDALASDQSLVVEVELVDAFAHHNTYTTARELLHARGHRLLLDRLTPLTFQLVDPGQFATDYLKVSWSPEMADPRRLKDPEQDPRRFIDAIGPEKFVLGRCDSEAALAWGVAQGIPWFQGRFVDSMLGAITMADCPGKAACTLQQCQARRSVVSGSLREACTQHDRLDALPDVLG